MNDIDYDWMNNLLIFPVPIPAADFIFIVVSVCYISELAESLVRKKKILQMI